MFRLSGSTHCFNQDLNCSLQFSRSVVSNSLWPHRLQHARLTCPSLSLRACSNSCPLSQWYHRTIPPSVAHFSWISTVMWKEHQLERSLRSWIQLSSENLEGDIREIAEICHRFLVTWVYICQRVFWKILSIEGQNIPWET